MVSISVVFWLMVIIAGIIGGMRGWAKELLVIFSVVLALFIIVVLETYVGFINGIFSPEVPTRQFWFRSVILLALAFFGYETPNLSGRFGGAARREKLQDSMLGIVLGGVNGYLIFGSIWHFIYEAGYPFEFIFAPDANTVIGQQAIDMVLRMPPAFLDIPGIYFAVAIAFTFVVIVFV